MYKGFTFNFDGKEYTVLEYRETEKNNVALIKRPTVNPYVVITDLVCNNGEYSWWHGTYFNNYDKAYEYFSYRASII